MKSSLFALSKLTVKSLTPKLACQNYLASSSLFNKTIQYQFSKHHHHENEHTHKEAR